MEKKESITLINLSRTKSKIWLYFEKHQFEYVYVKFGEKTKIVKVEIQII